MNELRVSTRAKDIHHTHTPTSVTYASVSKDLQTYSTVLKLGNIILRNSRCVVLELGDWGSTWCTRNRDAGFDTDTFAEQEWEEGNY